MRTSHGAILAVSFLLAAVLLFSCVSCGLRVSAEELSAGYTRQTSESGQVTDPFKAAMADFSLKLARQTVTRDQENDLVSPLSAILCLAMIANGAAGETRRQMEEVFGMDPETLNKCLYAYISSLYTADDCKVHLADSIWLRKGQGLQVKESFLQVNADWYQAQIYAAPFDGTTLKDINRWGEYHTDGMIDQILEEIPEDTVMYLINALAFDAGWAVGYGKSDVREDAFHNYDGTRTTVSFLFSEESVYLAGAGLQGFAKSYAGGKYSMVGLLPDGGSDIYDCLAGLTGDIWCDLWNGRTGETVQVAMPEFSYSVNLRLNEALQVLGMTDLFDAALADFSAMGSSPEGNLYCSEVQQKVFIQVDRNGTKAAAVTWGDMKGESADPEEPKQVTLDRPFLYAVVDNASGLPLFFGVVTFLAE